MPQVIDDRIVVPVKMLAVAFLVFLLASLVLAALWRRGSCTA